MNEFKFEKLFYTAAILAGLLLICLTVSLRRINEYSGRLRAAESRVDATIGQLEDANRRSTELIKDIGGGIENVKDAITSGAGTLSQRIRAVSKEVEIMEDRIYNYERAIPSVNNDSDSNSGE